jgi:hypothetical protein
MASIAPQQVPAGSPDLTLTIKGTNFTPESTACRNCKDIYDPLKKNLIWRGTASKALNLKAQPKKREEDIGKAITALVKGYPRPIKK